MFGSLVQKLQSLSPLGSPVTSPRSSPKTPRRRYKGRHNSKEEYREVQSDPELEESRPDGNKKRSSGRSRHLLDKRKAKVTTETSPRQQYSSFSPHPLETSKSLGRLDGLKEVQRLEQYEKFFQAIISESHHGVPEKEGLSKASNKTKEVLTKLNAEGDLERIQDQFPNDSLRLYDKDVVTVKMKGLIRKRSGTAARLQRALSAKALRSGSADTEINREQSLPRSGQEKRRFLMEVPVQFTTGVQSQDRHLFLFSDLLLVAKLRSGGNFKLKEKIRVSELWLTHSAMQDVIEVNKSPDTSFVIGWPTTNVVATFSTQVVRDTWWTKLNEVVETEREKEPKYTNIQVLYHDYATEIEYCKTFSIGPEETAQSCIRLALEHLEMRGLDPDNFQLWVKMARDESPYPLIGHERPFAIKLSSLRESLSTEEGFDLDHCNNVYGPDPLAKCQFILRSKQKNSPCVNLNMDLKKPAGATISAKKTRKSPMRITHVFKRSMSKGEECTDCPIISPVSNVSRTLPGVLFGIPLDKIAGPDTVPGPVLAMMQQIFNKGPYIQGIFRRSANARMAKELKVHLDTGMGISLDHVPVLTIAAVLKDYLRSLPDSLLGNAFYPLYMEAMECKDDQEKLARLKSVLDQLPRVNVTLLSYFVCLMLHIARNAKHNLMTPGNLAVCVGPSLLKKDDPDDASSRDVPVLIEFLLNNYEILLGPHVNQLLGETPERDQTRQDSGAEESDSLHSGGLRRDDSSIDSLERELLEPCPLPRKDKMSLSRDSGLTMSDSQLYTPDEEESGSTSSGSGRAVYVPAQSSCYEVPHSTVSSFSVPAATSTPTSYTLAGTQESQPLIGSGSAREYVRVYGGWEERVQECCNRSPWSEDSIYTRPLPQSTSLSGVINSNFQRQDWFRQRSQFKRLNSCGSSNSSNKFGAVTTSGSSTGSTSSGIGGLHRHLFHSQDSCSSIRRSASDESLLNEMGSQQYNDNIMSELIKKPVAHQKGKAPPPPPVPSSVSILGTPSAVPIETTREQPCSCCPEALMPRSKSFVHLINSPTVANHVFLSCETTKLAECSLNESAFIGGIRERRKHRHHSNSAHEDWSRSHSTPHIAAISLDDADQSYDSSTLSDDDSTPHVSRSNSRGKDCAAANSAWESAYGSVSASNDGPELLVHAAPISVHEESCSDAEECSSPPPRHIIADLMAPPLPPKRSSYDNKLRHLPPVHIDPPLRHNPMSEENGSREIVEGQTAGNVHERKGRLRNREITKRTFRRSKSLPPPPGQPNTENPGAEEKEELGKIEGYSLINTNNRGLKSEISWRVSQLRSLFNAESSRPPPYRHPPSVIPSHRAPITSYHLGKSSHSERYVISRQLHDASSKILNTTSEEESYV